MLSLAVLVGLVATMTTVNALTSTGTDDLTTTSTDFDTLPTSTVPTSTTSDAPHSTPTALSCPNFYEECRKVYPELYGSVVICSDMIFDICDFMNPNPRPGYPPAGGSSMTSCEVKLPPLDKCCIAVGPTFPHMEMPPECSPWWPGTTLDWTPDPITSPEPVTDPTTTTTSRLPELPITSSGTATSATELPTTTDVIATSPAASPTTTSRSTSSSEPVSTTAKATGSTSASSQPTATTSCDATSSSSVISSKTTISTATTSTTSAANEPAKESSGTNLVVSGAISTAPGLGAIGAIAAVAAVAAVF
ncbi:hypothetical protein HDU96_008985 [Phlyctochytrium bullatum]|nr:hypothetical protein HDU96_008985 [Phlyctochytrium bullatum]